MTDRQPRASHAALSEIGLDPETLERVTAAVEESADPAGAAIRIAPLLAADVSFAEPGKLEKAAALAGASRALTSALASNAHLFDGASPEDSVPLKLRGALIDIAGDDLCGRVDMVESTRRYSEFIDGMVSASLTRVRESVAEKHPTALEMPFAIIAMGKWGARELNYSSDIDLVFVHEPIAGDPDESRRAALAMASSLLARLSSPTFEGEALRVDADLRPEGTMGPLTRSLDSYESYYARWGEAWELQALLKARFVAGSGDLGHRFREMADRIIWEQGLDVDALRSIRLLKVQAEDSAPASDIKRSRGGIRDIEFTVQLLQLVHGGFDPDLRVPSTIAAAAVLGEHGYIDEEEADQLTDAYVFLRNLEHRIQLWDLRQTHDLPSSLDARERIGRSLGFEQDPAEELEKALSSVRRNVRSLHERLYFRPILDSLVGLPSARLDPADAGLRLEALGFRDVGAATTAFGELTTGLSRKSRVMHQILPLMLDWLSQSPDPDLGLAQLRLLLARTPDHGALVALLQNNPVAGERLCLLLGNGKLLGDLIDRIPEFIPRLASDERIRDVRDGEAAVNRLIALLDARPDRDVRVGTVRRFVRRRKLRIAARDVLGEAPTEATLRALSDTADAALVGALHTLTDGELEGFGVVAMGKWGGRELSYGSDLDLMYVYRNESDRARANELAVGLGQVLAEPSRHGEAYELDSDLRPEGRKGPLARSMEGFGRYYEHWVEPWELLALVRARPAAGDQDLGASFMKLIEPVLWMDDLQPQVTHGIRSIKARVESERIPVGEDPDFHLKLGPGGLSDVEFVTQLLQLQHGGADPGLRVPGTLAALAGLRDSEHITPADYNALADAYIFCTRVRLRLHLQKGRASDSLPTDPTATARLAASLGFDRTGELREQYRRYTRRSRRTFERLFYE
ncbi:MAG: bifunctional [glutamine synthetase] adenylyltransferase/[glutamine synthetase]-adenylyl-L-tyrosine phosphorylase [Actinomycetota bacterium]|nr:bifunctional [glutamine synthetase] adenylyltransferase/[glutamine synthetase]-adenylyl-L-tyrosine phosphorylase [Actinomycetota bacterium]